MFRSTITRVPLLFIGPDLVEGGRRFTDPVSMLDVLPTVLDLVGLAPPPVMQGQSLAPLLRGESSWQPRPVILEEIDTNPRSGEHLELLIMIDGRWGASLQLPNERVQAFEELRRPWPLLLYDLWNDPRALHPLNEQYPELVEKHTKLLEEQLETHNALAAQFSQPGESVLDPAQPGEAQPTIAYVFGPPIDLGLRDRPY